MLAGENWCWNDLAAGDVAAARKKRPRDLGRIEPLARELATTARPRLRDRDGDPLREVGRFVAALTPCRAWAYRADRGGEYDAEDLAIGFACERDGAVHAWEGRRSAGHRCPPSPHVEVGESFTLLVDPAGDILPIPLECLELRFALTYAELYRAAQALPAGATRMWAVDAMLDVLGDVRTTEPELIHQAFAHNKTQFSTRAHDAFYVVSDLMALVRQGQDPLRFLVGTDVLFGSRELLIPVYNQYRVNGDATLAP